MRQICIRYILRLLLALRKRCDALSMHQRRLIVYSLCVIYLCTFMATVISAVLPKGKEGAPSPILPVDSPTEVCDSLKSSVLRIHSMAYNYD